MRNLRLSSRDKFYRSSYRYLVAIMYILMTGLKKLNLKIGGQ